MSRLSCTISEISDILLENRDYSIAINLLKLADYFKEEEDSPRGKPSRILSRFFCNQTKCLAYLGPAHRRLTGRTVTLVTKSDQI